MGTWRNLKITLEEIMSDEMPGAARFPPEKHTHMGRMCISWLRMVRRVLAAAKQAREDDEGIPEVLTGTQREKHSEEPFSGVPWFGEDIHRALCYIQVVKGKNKKSKYAAHAGERSSYGGSVVLPRFHYPDTFKARIHLSPQTHVGIHLGVFPITRLPKRLHLREQYIRQLRDLKASLESRDNSVADAGKPFVPRPRNRSHSPLPRPNKLVVAKARAPDGTFPPVTRGRRSLAVHIGPCIWCASVERALIQYSLALVATGSTVHIT